MTTSPCGGRTHPCPGGCGADVPDRFFACDVCWRLLPRELQQPILRTSRKNLLDLDRRAAVTAASHFYRGTK
jgi:hypothetical protein